MGIPSAPYSRGEGGLARGILFVGRVQNVPLPAHHWASATTINKDGRTEHPGVEVFARRRHDHKQASRCDSCPSSLAAFRLGMWRRRSRLQGWPSIQPSSRLRAGHLTAS